MAKFSNTSIGRTSRKLLTGAAIVLSSTTALAVPLIDGLGGTSGYGELAMQPNDDGSSNELDLNFNANFFGTTYDSFFINNNGNISFNNSVGSYTPEPFPSASQPMIAPFWADVDTSGTDGGAVYVAAPNDGTTVITWNDVGYYWENNTLTNNFQLVLRDRSADGVAGDFDIEFRYDRLEWTTGDASNGSGGLGGTPAQAGFDAGNQTDFFVLPGSLTSDVLNLQNQTNVANGENGLWSFAIRQGSNPGETPSNPLLPVIVDGSYTFEFGVDLNQQVFVDPEVAIGYTYEITDSASPLFASVEAPTGFGDDLYELWLWNGVEYVFDETLTGGVEFFFASALDRFQIRGIEANLGVDPTDPTAFVTGLTFASAGTVSMSQTPIVFNTDPPGGSVPEPSTLALFLFGLTGYSFLRRKTSALV